MIYVHCDFVVLESGFCIWRRWVGREVIDLIGVWILLHPGTRGREECQWYAYFISLIYQRRAIWWTTLNPFKNWSSRDHKNELDMYRKLAKLSPSVPFLVSVFSNNSKLTAVEPPNWMPDNNQTYSTFRTWVWTWSYPKRDLELG